MLLDKKSDLEKSLINGDYANFFTILEKYIKYSATLNQQLIALQTEYVSGEANFKYSMRLLVFLQHCISQDTKKVSLELDTEVSTKEAKRNILDTEITEREATLSKLKTELNQVKTKINNSTRNEGYAPIKFLGFLGVKKNSTLNTIEMSYNAFYISVGLLSLLLLFCLGFWVAYKPKVLQQAQYAYVEEKEDCKNPQDCYDKANRILGKQDNDLDNKIDWLDLAIKKDDYYLEAYLLRAETNHKRKNFASAIKDCGRAIYIQKNAKTYILLGDSQMKLEPARLEDALESYNSAISIDTNRSEAYRQRGICYTKLSRQDEALNDFEKAFRLNPSDTMACMEIAKWHNARQKKAETIKFLVIFVRATNDRQKIEDDKSFDWLKVNYSFNGVLW